jgi:hypothetical protein
MRHAIATERAIIWFLLLALISIGLTRSISGGAERRPLDAVVRRGTHESSRNKSLYNHCHLAGYFIHGEVTPRF